MISDASQQSDEATVLIIGSELMIRNLSTILDLGLIFVVTKVDNFFEAWNSTIGVRSPWVGFDLVNEAGLDLGNFWRHGKQYSKSRI